MESGINCIIAHRKSDTFSNAPLAMSQAEGILFVVTLTAAMIASLCWVARDARKRKSGFSVVILCFLTWPFGILVWLLLRPGYYLPDAPSGNVS
jgi:hypothetical protein